MAKKTDNKVKKFDYKSIKTYEDACNAKVVDKDNVIFETDSFDIICYKKLKHIISVINEGWVPDWNNFNQRKWWPWFRLSSGFGFGSSYYNFSGTITYVGSHLCFQSEEKSDYTATQFLDLYKGFLTI